MLLNTLPGDIPGLLRRGSPVITPDGYDDMPPSACGVVLIVPSDVLVIGWRWSDDPDQIEDERISKQVPSLVVLDLTDPTGRWEAAMWAKWEAGNQGGPIWSSDEQCAFARAIHDELMTPAQIDTLARLVLRLAGRTP